MGKSKHVGNKHLYIGTSKNPKRMDTIVENVDTYIWKKDDKRLHDQLKEERKNKEEVKESDMKLQSFSYTLYCNGRGGRRK